MMKRLALYAVLFSLGLSLNSWGTVTQAEDFSDVDELVTGTCPGDYFGFIVGVRSKNTRDQFYTDLYKKGYCQLTDILAVEDELDELRKTFRQAALSCQSTSNYKAQYHKLLMEQYFVRNIQKVKSDVITKEEAEVYAAKKQDMLDDLEEDMVTIFVVEEERVSETVLRSYFEDWSSKYWDRLDDYNDCREGGWAEVDESMDKFLDTMRGLMEFDIEKPERHSLNGVFVPDTEVNGEEDFNPIVKPFVNGYEFLNSGISKRKLEIENEKTIKELTVTGETYTYESLFNALIESQTIAGAQEAGAERMERYRQLYGYGGAVAATDMQGVAQELNRILQESNTKDFPNIQAQAAKVYDKQCN